MTHTECKDCELSNGDCGYHFKMDGTINYDIASLSACDKYGNCEFFKSKAKPKGDIFPMKIVAGKCPIEAGGNCPLRPQGEWIPVSERLPEENGVYLVTLECVEDCEIVYEDDMAWFVYSEKDDCNNGFHKAYPVIAWQPLPKPYEKGGAE